MAAFQGSFAAAVPILFPKVEGSFAAVVEDSVVGSVVGMLLLTVYSPWSESSHHSLVSGGPSSSSAPRPSYVPPLLLLLMPVSSVREAEAAEVLMPSVHVHHHHLYYYCLYVGPRSCHSHWGRYERVQVRRSSSSWVE